MLENIFFALGAPAAAPGAAGAPAAGGNSWFSLVFMLAIFVVFYFVLIFPESRRRKKLQKELSEMKSGDEIILASGIMGTVEHIENNIVHVRSLDSKFKVGKEFVAQIKRPGAAK